MSRYIDLDETIDCVNQRFFEECLKHYDKPEVCKLCLVSDVVDVVGILKNMPIADVVEVVRCEHCKHYDGKFCLTWDKRINDNGYCYLGEVEVQNE